MSTKTFITAVATVAFAIAATATTVTNAFAQSTAAPAANSSSATTGATIAVAGGALAAPKAASKDSGLTRAEVIAQVLEARKNGTIPETEADYDVAQTKKHFAK